MIKAELVIIGAGPAGMSAAVAARKKGIESILLLDRNPFLGGILEQCIHNGFGLHKFKEELTGPEYAYKYSKQVEELGIEYKLGTMVLDVTPDKIVTAVNERDGVFSVQAKAVILAMGCRERSRGALNISGTRPAGIFTAGTAQKYVNIDGYLPGKKVVILGSGDIGLIMARRMTLEGSKVEAVCELMPYSGGLTRNIVQCLDDFGIPLLLSHTVTKIHGDKRVTGVTICEVDENRRPIPGKERYIECDTLLLSVGLIPENELSKKASVTLDPITSGAVVNGNRETTVPGIFACGNVLHVHDLVDFVSDEAEIAGNAAADYIMGKNVQSSKRIKLSAGFGVRYTVPQIVDAAEDTKVFFRVTDVFRKVKILVKDGDRTVLSLKREHCAPGEMESVLLKKTDIESIAGDNIDILLEVEE